MLYDFDKPVERRGTYSAKWDGIPLFSAAGISERGGCGYAPAVYCGHGLPMPAVCEDRDPESGGA